MTPENKSSYTFSSLFVSSTCELEWLDSSFSSVFVSPRSFEPSWWCIWTVSPTIMAKLKPVDELLALMLDQGGQFGWSVGFFPVSTPVRKTFTESGKSVTASSRDKEVTSVCFIWCAKRFDVILDDLYCCFNKSQLLFFSIFISLLLIKLLEYCWCSGIESNHIWFAINVSYYYFVTKILF